MLKYVGEFTAEVENCGQLPFNETNTELDDIFTVVNILTDLTYRRIEEAIIELEKSEKPNLGYIELYKNMRTYKRILDGFEGI